MAGDRPSRASTPKRSSICARSRAVLLAEAAVLQRALDGQADLAQLEGLRQVVVGALAHGLDGRLQAAEGRHEDHAGAGLTGLRRAQKGEAVDLAHDEVREDHFDLLALDRGQRPRAADRGGDGVPVALEMASEEVDHLGVVVGHEDSPGHRGGARPSRYIGAEPIAEARPPDILVAGR